MRTVLVAVFLFFSSLALAQKSHTFSLTSPDTALHVGYIYTQPEILMPEPGQVLIRPEEQPRLDSVADFILKHPGIILCVGYHSDQLGTDTVNTQFTQTMVNRVVTYLRSKGIPWTSVVGVGYGERFPLVKESEILKQADVNERTRLYRKNRRIEYSILRSPRPTIDLRNPVVQYGWIDYPMRYKPGKADLDSACFPFLDSLAEFLLANPAVHLEIENHLDARWNPASSSNLSGNRAKNVAKYLVNYGVPQWRVQGIGFADVRPIASEKMVNAAPGKEGKEALHAVNRRTEFRISRLDSTPAYFTLSNTVFSVNMFYRLAQNDSPQDQPYLDSIAVLMKTHPELLFEIQCHTDTRGKNHMRRSTTDANRIRSYLIARGVDSTSIHANGYGDQMPVWPKVLVNRETDSLRRELMERENRRTLFRIVHIQDSTFSYTDTVFTIGARHNLYILFPGNEIKPQPSSLPLLDSLTIFLLSHPKLRVEIGVHDGPREWMNEERCLSCERATFIRNYLIGKGVPAQRLTAKGYKSTAPLVPYTSVWWNLPYNAEQIRERINQRTEIRITRCD